MTDTANRRGSQWHRWDPHIHTPGTLFNDQYGGVDSWDEFLIAIETSDPPLRALGVTDYYSLDSYETAVQKKKEGRLPGVEYIFANVEMRYGIGTGVGAPINVHLMVSSDEPDHVDQIRRFLRNFTFDAYGESFRCDTADLIRLGRCHDSGIQNDRSALIAGANQFKVNPDQLRNEWKRSLWIQKNSLIAVAAGSNDGTSGLQGDASLATQRREIERLAHIIFSGQTKPRDFWLGRGPASVDELNLGWGGCKPCLHGSDAHQLDHAGHPTGDRYCWIKGDLGFETLKQVCLEPATRVSIGALPPRGALPSHVISDVTVTDAPWLTQPSLPLNRGLVAIIGARGSGKTALADIIAAGGLAVSPHLNERSFIRRARNYLGDGRVELAWEDGACTSNELQNVEFGELFDSPRVRYLSQQFVDTLCSSEGATDELLDEVERVIFQAHPIEDRMGTTTFRELLEIRASRGRAIRQRHEAAIAEAGRELNIERDRKAKLPVLERQRLDKALAIGKDKRDRATLLAKGGTDRAKQLDLISTAAEAVRIEVQLARRRRDALISLRDEVTFTRTDTSPHELRQLKQTYAESALPSDSWPGFLLDFVGNVDAILANAIKDVDTLIASRTGPLPKEPVFDPNAPAPIHSLLRSDVPPETQTLTILDKEVARLRKLVGIDAENAKLFGRLSEKVAREEAALSKLDRDIDLSRKATARIAELIQYRRETYGRVFDGIIEEEKELSRLYEPLKLRLGAEPGALNKLSFSIRRQVDAGAWSAAAEKLLDLRKAGPFKGRGALLEAAQTHLMVAWEQGTSAEVAMAMNNFREKHERDIVEHSPVDGSNPDAFRDWSNHISAWLYGTDHIRINYGIRYEGVDIAHLSPGTRGIVLLLLYLAIDKDDDRPLLIDQPEENLDPKSIFEELVGRFREAKLHRQIIIVTHNANLVVNADADQVIIAAAGPHRPGRLPQISYQCGGLENEDIRRHVCEILEGGEAAFKERARRLRVRL